MCNYNEVHNAGREESETILCQSVIGVTLKRINTPFGFYFI